MDFSDEDKAILNATVEVIHHSGAKSFELGWQYDDVPIELMGWYAEADHGATKVRAEGKGPIQAADTLAKRILDGGLCLHCNRRVTVTDIDDLEKCFRARVGERWLRGCEVEFPETDGPQPTKRKLAHALLIAGAPMNMIEAANKGYFDDYESELDLPIFQLVADCEKLFEQTGNEALRNVAERAKNGEFDASKEEAARYWKSDEGKQIMSEFGVDPQFTLYSDNFTGFDEGVKPQGSPQSRSERRRAARAAKKNRKKK